MKYVSRYEGFLLQFVKFFGYKKTRKYLGAFLIEAVYRFCVREFFHIGLMGLS